MSISARHRANYEFSRARPGVGRPATQAFDPPFALGCYDERQTQLISDGCWTGVGKLRRKSMGRSAPRSQLAYVQLMLIALLSAAAFPSAWAQQPQPEASGNKPDPAYQDDLAAKFLSHLKAPLPPREDGCFRLDQDHRWEFDSLRLGGVSARTSRSSAIFHEQHPIDAEPGEFPPTQQHRLLRYTVCTGVVRRSHHI